MLGPNGAGKTTAVRILTTLAIPDSGWARVAGHDVVSEAAAVRRKIGVTAQDATLDEALTGRQNLVMVGELSGLRRPAAKSRADGPPRAFRARRCRRSGDEGLLRRDAPSPRSRGGARHPPAGALPRRTDDRPRPHESDADVDGHP